MQPEELKAEALKDLNAVAGDKDLDAWRVRFLGRKGELTTILRGLAAMPEEERRAVGAQANQVKNLLEQAFDEKQTALKEAELSAAGTQGLDITLPGRPQQIGKLHLLSRTIQEICDIFVSMGFTVADGPDADWDKYVFEALNMPAEHPARDNMSSIWIDQKNDKGQQNMLLRTHCTSVSARAIENQKPPIRQIAPGRVYRYEATDATHLSMFMQVDGLVVDKGITMGDLKGTLYEFSRRFFGEDKKVRFRCDYFPFVEPGVEMAVECVVCHGKGCQLCKNSGWIEVLGAGMTHPDVLRRGGIDPEVYSSFAWGMGIERLPMLRYGIDDIRLLYGSDLRFLRQF